MKGLGTLLVVCFFTLLCGCMLKFEDVSEESEYVPLLSTRYSLMEDMRIQGVNLGPGYGKDIHVYMIDPVWLKITGPEIITEDILNSGTILEVRSVQRSINSVLLEGKKVQAVVEVNPCAKAADVPVVIDLKYLQSTNYMQRIEP